MGNSPDECSVARIAARITRPRACIWYNRSLLAPAPSGPRSPGVVGPVALALVVGVTVPLDWGLVPAVAVVVAAGLWARRSGRPFAQPGDSFPAKAGWILAPLRGFSAAILAAVFAITLGELLVEFPAAIWALIPVGLAVGLSFAWARSRIGLAALALAVPLAGVLGAVVERGGADAEGWAHSGPILGIHPWQITGVVIDGIGPFDIPINDYVEPDGTRGYGPEELAGVVERTLRTIAEQQFGDGPARAHQAFAAARVEAVRTAPVRESLSREVTAGSHPRFRVRSGTSGDRSSVEFVCPGARVSPGPRQRDPVTQRMCPTKYASEASAGLGLTGRWVGYAEGRGNARVALARLFGWTRTDDEAGHAVRRREIQLWALIALVGLGALWARRRSDPSPASDGLVGLGGWLCSVIGVALGVCLGVAMLANPAGFGAFEAGPAVLRGPWLLPWLAVFVVLGPWGGETTAGSRGLPVLVTAATMGVALSLRELVWVRPPWDGFSVEPFVAGAADLALRTLTALGMGQPPRVESAEAAVAAVGVGLLCGALAWVPRALPSADGPGPSGGRPGAVRLLWLAVAVALVAGLSRKPGGLDPLIPTAVAMTFALSSAYRVLRNPGVVLPRVMHLFAVVTGVWLALEGLHWPIPAVALLCVGCGIVCILATVILWAGAKPAVEPPGSQGYDSPPSDGPPHSEETVRP